MSEDTIQLCTYRFNLSKDLMDELLYFSKLHQFDDRKTFKEEWKKWKDEPDNALLIQLESNRLVHEGYSGNIEEKIFKSVRYYLKNKREKETPENPKKRKQYESLSDKFLKKIDENIMEQLNTHIISKTKNVEKNILISDISPAEAYASFCKNNAESISEEVNMMLQRNPNKKIDSQELSNKFKKTYKNRFFNIRVSLENK